MQNNLMIGVLGLDECDDSFRERAEILRQECRAELGASSTEAPRLCNDRPLNAVPRGSAEQTAEDGSWQRISIAIDSGAVETVIPHKLVKQHRIRDTEASLSGLNYVSATGDPIPNLGEQRLPLCTQEGTLRSMTFQAAPVERALGSVKRMCASDHRVVFDEEGSYVVNKITREVNWLREDNGNYMLDAWVMPGPGFARQR